MSIAPVIMWFRRDLRLSDNSALNAALRSGSPIICVFVFDPVILKSRNMGAPRMAFLLNALLSLDTALRQFGGTLVVRHGNPVQVLSRLIEETGAAALYLNRDYSPYSLRRDAAVQRAATVPVYGFDDTLLVTPGELVKEDGTAYTVFTPFKRRWLAIPKAIPEPVRVSWGQFAHHLTDAPGLDRFTLHDLDFGSTIAVPDSSEAKANQRLSDFVSSPIFDYENGRNRLSADPDLSPLHSTSFLSPYIHFGILSIRKVYQAADRARQAAGDNWARKSVETWIGELAWREFYQHILFYFPRVTRGNFRPAYDDLEWRNAPDNLQAWKDGRTGYPLVDAAMRQLRQVGWMPNRARMIVASFLTKDLLIDWRAGEEHFMHWLVDGDLAANNGGWQWAAGTGTDAQPYFRIFNPVSQSRTFDSDGTYIRRWIPELSEVHGFSIHAPWEMAQPPTDYPPPIVEHGFARQRALEAFGKVKHRQ